MYLQTIVEFQRIKIIYNVSFVFVTFTLICFQFIFWRTHLSNTIFITNKPSLNSDSLKSFVKSKTRIP